jgi:spermidine synthase
LELWLTERETDHVLTKCRIDRTLYQGRSKYQHVAVVESREYGRMLVLDGIVQTSIRDEFIYHEMIAHVPLTIHPRPEKVLVIGAGDGGTIREVLKHPEVKRVCHVEIDEMVIEVSRQYFPELAGMLDDPRVEQHITDGIQYVKEQTAAFDAIIIDSSDPLGPAEGLFTEAFYGDAAKALKPDGIMVVQAGPPFYLPKLIRSIYRAIEKSFPTVRLYFASIPTYSAAPYAFVLASRRPLDDIAPRRELANLRYWTPEIHRAAFLVPPFLKEMLEIDG